MCHLSLLDITVDLIHFNICMNEWSTWQSRNNVTASADMTDGNKYNTFNNFTPQQSLCSKTMKEKKQRCTTKQERGYLKFLTWSCIHDVGLATTISHQPRWAGHADRLWTYWLDPKHVYYASVTTHTHTHAHKKNTHPLGSRCLFNWRSGLLFQWLSIKLLTLQASLTWIHDY